MATDLEVGIRYELRGVRATRSGTAIVPVLRLISILRETSDEEISIDSSIEKTVIRTSAGKFEMLGGDPDTFPDVPHLEPDATYHEIRAGVLRTQLRRTSFAAEKKENARYNVNGVLWEFANNVGRFVATDTKRLAYSECPVDSHGETSATSSQIVPLKTITLLERNLTDEGELIRVSFKPNAAVFQTERALIHSGLGSGKFPPYRDIFPKKHGVSLSLPVADFTSRLRQAAIMIDEESKRVDFDFQPGKVTLSARGAETGMSDVSLDLPESQASLKIAFDPSYILEMLRAIDGETTITLEMTDGMKPAVFKLGSEFLYLVMPMGG
jgi:DNA polymerase-3 subunit beta